MEHSGATSARLMVSIVEVGNGDVSLAEQVIEQNTRIIKHAHKQSKGFISIFPFWNKHIVRFGLRTHSVDLGKLPSRRIDPSERAGNNSFLPCRLSDQSLRYRISSLLRTRCKAFSCRFLPAYWMFFLSHTANIRYKAITMKNIASEISMVNLLRQESAEAFHRSEQLRSEWQKLRTT